MAGTLPTYVVVELSGRIGNQLFQYASGLGIARHHGARLVFTAPLVEANDLLLPRLIGDRYVEATECELLSVGQFAWSVPPTRAWASAAYHGARALRRIAGRTPPSLTVWENTGVFKPYVFELDLPVYVQGHLQSERYFTAYADEIVGSLRWPADLPFIDTGELPTVAVSFRRGDYNALGWTLPLDYYERALELVAKYVGRATFVLFGDDSAFVSLMAERIARIAPVIDTLTIASDPLSQLHFMSRCDHCVMSNSSFAWWGAWLGDHGAAADRIVIAPDEYRSRDRVPKRWKTLETGVPPS